MSFHVRDCLPPDRFLRTRGDTARCIAANIMIFITLAKKSPVISALVKEK